MHYELEEVVKDVYPDDTKFDIRTAIQIGIRESIRYRMVPMKFQKIVYRLHTDRMNGFTPVGQARGSAPELKF